MRTSRPGRIEGYALFDAIVAVLAASIALGAAFFGLSTAMRQSLRCLERAIAIVEERNADAATGCEGVARTAAASETAARTAAASEAATVPWR